jgi:GGDEF domain-containing protein
MSATDWKEGRGSPNRRAAEQALVKDMAGAERAGTPSCIALFDVDHFSA